MTYSIRNRMTIVRINNITLFFILAIIVWSCQDQHNSSSYPPGVELRSLAEDVESLSYKDLIATMTKEDLDDEWKRVATPDNYIVFRNKHGGMEIILADNNLNAAYKYRKQVADKFIAVITEAYHDKKKNPPFDKNIIEQLLSEMAERSSGIINSESIPVENIITSPGAQNQWPCFRGPDGQGIASAKEFPLEWSKTHNILWKVALTGRGNSSPIVWENRVFITSASSDGKTRELFCYSRSNGELLWKRTAPAPEKIEKINPKNSYASATPVTDGERVIAFFGNCGFMCCNMNGKILWMKNTGEFTTMHGPGTNPVLYKDKVILIQDQTNNKSVFLALDKNTGEIRWSQERSRNAGWANPVFVKINEHDELIYNGSFKVDSYNPDTGEWIWSVDGPTKEAVPMIVTGDGMIFSASGRNGTILAIRPGGKGDITGTHLVWANKTGGPHIPSPVYHNGRLYIINDTGILTCLRTSTGETVWRERLKGKFTSSLVLAADKLIVTNEEGLTTILETGDSFKMLFQNDLGEETLSSPAVLDGCIVLRTALNLYCIGIKK